MKCTLQLQLLPTKSQHQALLDIMQAFNAAATYVAQVAFAEELFTRKFIYARFFYDLRERFHLPAHMTMQVIAKVWGAIQQDHLVCPEFKATETMIFGKGMISWQDPAHVSLFTLEGRQSIAMVFGRYLSGVMPRLKGECDLVYRDGAFYLLTPIDLPEAPPLETRPLTDAGNS